MFNSAFVFCNPLLKMYNAGDPVVKMLPVQGAQIPSLVEGTEIPHARTAQQKRKKKKCNRLKIFKEQNSAPP